MIRGQALPLVVEVSRGEVLRNLGYPRGRQPASKVTQVLDSLWGEAIGLLDPRGAFCEVDQEAAAAMDMPRPAAQVGLGVCTIGPNLEDREARLSEENKLLQALLLDAFGSAAAEAAADALNQALCAAAREQGFFLKPRVSPGYGSWDVRCQRPLLNRLPIEELGIHLTGGMMMVPRKSVSFAAPLYRRGRNQAGSGHAGSALAPRCTRCTLLSCEYREAPYSDNDHPCDTKRRTPS